MSTLNQVKLTLQRLLMKFGEAHTDKGILSYLGEMPEVGAAVFLNDEPAADGSYILEDGTTIRVADGKVAEIILKEEAPVEEIEAAEEEAPAEEIVEEIPVEDPAPAEPDMQAILLEVLNPVVEKVAALEARVEATEARLQEIESKLLEAQAKPADEVIEEVEPESGFFRAGYNKKR